MSLASASPVPDDFGKLARLGMRVERAEVDDVVDWSFRASPWPRIVKSAGLGLLCLIGSRMISGYQWIGLGLLAACSLWMLLFIPRTRLVMRPGRCDLVREALIVGLLPLRLPAKSVAAIDVAVYQTSSARSLPRVVLALETRAGRVHLWSFPVWLNAARLREETESAVRRAGVILCRDLRLVGEVSSDG